MARADFGQPQIDALVQRGLQLHREGRLAEAEPIYQDVLRRQPKHSGVLHLLGLVAFQSGQAERSIALFDRAIAIRRDFPEAYDNRGTALYALNRFEEAVASYDRALRLKPDYAVSHSNRAGALGDLGRHEDAVASYQKSIALSPDSAKVHRNFSMCLLRLGRFDVGWREYEWRRQIDNRLSARQYAQPIWTGQESSKNKTIFIYPEQGLGDTIQFCRYAAMLAAQEANIVLSSPTLLHGLIATLHPAITVIGESDVPDHFDFHCPLMSLPLAFGTDLDTIPAFPNYLSADDALRSGWTARLGPKDKPRIGVVWSGSRLHKNDANRSIPFSLFQSILSGGADWLSLQNELRPAEADLVLASSSIRYVGDALKSFSDTAALIDQLDLVITVDSSVAHLAGALGKPAWILLPFNADWRWLRDRRDSPWYPTARLFRQAALGDWPTVLEAVKSELPIFLDGLGA
jgi:Tfp pilus assembly protein PilF